MADKKKRGDVGLTVVGEAEGAGAIIWWELPGRIPRDAIAEVLAERGLSKLTPKRTTPSRALRRALDEFSERRVLVRPVSKGVWLVQRELVIKNEDGSEGLEYHPWFEAKLSIQGEVLLTPKNGTPEPTEQVRAAFAYALVTLDGDEMGTWLSQTIVPAVRGVTIRRQGGVYYILPEGMSLINAINSILEQVGPENIIYCPPAMKNDASVVRVVMDGMQAEASAILQEVQLGMNEEKGLSDRGKEARLERLDALRAKLKRYNAIFKSPVLALESKLQELTVKLGGAAHAIAMQGARAGQGPIVDAADKRFSKLELDEGSEIEAEEIAIVRPLDLSDDKPEPEDAGPEDSGRQLDLD